jgi:hypothetical protein
MVFGWVKSLFTSVEKNDLNWKKHHAERERIQVDAELAKKKIESELDILSLEMKTETKLQPLREKLEEQKLTLHRVKNKCEFKFRKADKARGLKKGDYCPNDKENEEYCQLHYKTLNDYKTKNNINVKRKATAEETPMSSKKSKTRSEYTDSSTPVLHTGEEWKEISRRFTELANNDTAQKVSTLRASLPARSNSDDEADNIA